MVRQIVARVSNEQLQQDLEKYRLKALELGAADAKIITTDMILVDEKVRAKCVFPKCDFYGISGCCPPHAMDLDTVRRIVQSYHFAVFHRITVPARVMSWQTEEDRKAFADLNLKNSNIVNTLESMAFYDGYYLALGLSNGSCKSIFCRNVPCTILTSHESCRGALKARSSMEGWGLDAFRMAASVGWDIYSIGRARSTDHIPHGTRLGLVMVY